MTKPNARVIVDDELVQRFVEYRRRIVEEENGYLFHVMLDDGNVEDIFALETVCSTIQHGDPEAIDLAIVCTHLSKTQRLKLGYRSMEGWMRIPIEFQFEG